MVSKNARPLGDSSRTSSSGSGSDGDDVRADRDDPPAQAAARRRPCSRSWRRTRRGPGSRRATSRRRTARRPRCRIGRARTPSCRSAPARGRGGGEPGEVATRMEQAAALHDQRPVVGVGADLLADTVARHDRGARHRPRRGRRAHARAGPRAMARRPARGGRLRGSRSRWPPRRSAASRGRSESSVSWYSARPVASP